MARTHNGVTHVRTPYRSLSGRGGSGATHGEMTVVFDPHVRAEFLLNRRIRAVLEECGEMPSDESIAVWRDQILDALYAKAVGNV